LKSADPGLYAVVPVSPELPKCHPGVIFCLRQRGLGGRAEDSEKINPLHPYFLVYVLDSGDIQYSFAAPKQILQIFRELASGQPSAHDKLCDIFDAQTKNGEDMSAHSDLASKAIASITRTFQRRAAASLLGSRSGVLPTASEVPSDSPDGFDLVTWLVIMNPK
jgi:hypothetical protein